MNTHILHTAVQEFILKNLKSNITQLILKGSPFEDISIQELANQIIAKQKSKHRPAGTKADRGAKPSQHKAARTP